MGTWTKSHRLLAEVGGVRAPSSHPTPARLPSLAYPSGACTHPSLESPSQGHCCKQAFWFKAEPDDRYQNVWDCQPKQKVACTGKVTSTDGPGLRRGEAALGADGAAEETLCLPPQLFFHELTEGSMGCRRADGHIGDGTHRSKCHPALLQVAWCPNVPPFLRMGQGSLPMSKIED